LLTTGSVHDVNALDYLPIEAGAYYIMEKKSMARCLIICINN
jgi:hypothetical protein